MRLVRVQKKRIMMSEFFYRVEMDLKKWNRFVKGVDHRLEYLRETGRLGRAEYRKKKELEARQIE